MKTNKTTVARRLLWLLLSPLYIVNIVFGLVVALPYWIFTGKFYYDTKYFKSVMVFLSSIPISK